MSHLDSQIFSDWLYSVLLFFVVGLGFSILSNYSCTYPGARFSVGIIHVVSSPISSLHLSTLSSLGFFVMHLFLFIKLLLDLSRCLPSSSPCIMCWSSFVTFVRSQSACTDRRISGGAIPDRVYSLFIGVFLSILWLVGTSHSELCLFSLCVQTFPTLDLRNRRLRNKVLKL